MTYSNKEIKALLEDENNTVVFELEYLPKYEFIVTSFRTSNHIYFSIARQEKRKDGLNFLTTESMNVDKFTPTQVKLYTFDMLDRQHKVSIKYSDMKITNVQDHSEEK